MMKTDNKLDLYEAIETLYYLLAQPLFLHNTYTHNGYSLKVMLMQYVF